MQGCKTNGPVTRDSDNLNLCGDSSCPRCNMFHKALAADDSNFIEPNDDLPVPPMAETTLLFPQLEK